MKKIVLSLMMLCCFAFMGVAQSQNTFEGISVKSHPDFTTMVSNDRATSDGVWLTYTPDELDEVYAVGVGMGFWWGAMFPASMLSQYAGTTITKVGFLDLGDEQNAGTYEVRLYLGGETQGETMVSTQTFQITGTVGDIVDIPLTTAVNITGTQNLWVMYYQDGSIMRPAPAVEDFGEPNDRWIMVENYGWFDIAEIGGGLSFSWLVWAYAEGYDLIGENTADVAVYPNPTSDYVTIQALDMNHITVLNTLGQVVYNADVTGNLQKLDMSQYEAGVYMVRVVTENGTKTQHVVVR